MLDRPYLTESGAVVSNINLHNPNWLMMNDWIHEGGEYEMVMSMDIITVLLPPVDWNPPDEAEIARRVEAAGNQDEKN